MPAATRFDDLTSAADLADAVRAGAIRAVDVVTATLARIEERNGPLNAFVHVDAEGALAAAERIDAMVAAGQDPGLLAGVPIGVKDIEHCTGMPTAYASRLFLDAEPATSDAIGVARLRAAGAIPIGKTAAPEFGNGGATFSEAFGVTRNPWATERTPGGSSGGSSAAVSSGMVHLATASDGGGSTRGPAAFCGLVGLKPTFGRIPALPVRAVSAAGAVVPTVTDAARHLDVVTGADDRDWTSLPRADHSYEASLQSVDLAAAKVVWSELGYPRVDEETFTLTHGAAEALVAAAGLRRSATDWTPTRPVTADTLSAASAMDDWLLVDTARFREHELEIGADVRAGRRASMVLTAPEMAVHHKERMRFAAEVAEVFRSHDFVLTPCSSVPPFAADLPYADAQFGGKTLAYGPDPQLLLASLCGNPAIAVPAGVTRDGLPVGLQIIGRRHADREVLALARAFELACPWPRYPPALS